MLSCYKYKKIRMQNSCNSITNKFIIFLLIITWIQCCVFLFFFFTVLIDNFTDQFGYDKYKRGVILSVLSAEKYGRLNPFSLWFHMIEMSKYVGSSVFKHYVKGESFFSFHVFFKAVLTEMLKCPITSFSIQFGFSDRS